MTKWKTPKPTKTKNTTENHVFPQRPAAPNPKSEK